MAEKKITTGEVVGHLRTASRLFKSFEFANEAAELVLKAESSVKKLEKEIVSLESEKETLNKECDELVAKATAAEQEIVTHKQFVQDAAKVAAKAAEEARVLAKAEAKSIIYAAKNEAEVLREKTKTSIADMDRAIAGKKKAEIELAQIVAQVEQAKEAFLKNFG